MNLLKNVGTVCVVASLLSSCAIDEGHKKQNIGAFSGAAIGGIVGAYASGGNNPLVGGLIGATVGGLAGGLIGNRLDKRDREYQEKTTIHALEYNRSGTSSTWRNPDSDHSGVIVIKNTKQNSRGEYCREFTQKVVIGGKTETAYGLACRKPDGQWEIQS